MNTRERFETTFAVLSYEADVSGKLSLFALFNRLQDLAGMHAEYLQVGYDRLRESKLAWMLSRIKVRINALPHWSETVHLATWPKGIDRLFAMRDFCLNSDTGETLALATSAWLLVDIERSRPQRIENLPVDLRFPGAPHAIQETPEKIQMPERLLTVYSKPIWLSDLDINRHVNNAQYAKWVGDCFAEDHFRNRRMASVQINFLEETLLGDTIDLLRVPDGPTADEYYVAGRSRQKGSIVFHARVRWI